MSQVRYNGWIGLDRREDDIFVEDLLYNEGPLQKRYISPENTYLLTNVKPLYLCQVIEQKPVVSRIDLRFIPYRSSRSAASFE